MNWTQWRPFTPSGVDTASKTLNGVYEIALDGYLVQYPNGKSQTVYYGESHGKKSSIHARLKAHLAERGDKQIAKLMKAGYPLRYRYDTSVPDPGAREAILLAVFELRFGVCPFGNDTCPLADRGLEEAKK